MYNTADQIVKIKADIIQWVTWKFFFSAFMLQNVIMGHMDMAVLTTVVVTV